MIFPGALGDLICAVPAIRAIARRHPKAAVELMARAELVRFATGRLGFPRDQPTAAARVSEGGSQADSASAGCGHSRGHSIDRREVAQLFAARSGTLAKEAKTFFGSFSHVYSFFAADDSHFRAALATATDGRATFFPFRPTAVGHVAAAYLREIETGNGTENAGQGSAKTTAGSGTIGAGDAGALDCSLEPYPEDLELAGDRIAALGLEAGNFMLVLPGSGSKAKNWPATSFVSLATLMTSWIRPLVILGPAESALEPIFTAAGTPVVTQLELSEVAALARLSRCFIGNDSGVSHLAAASGSPGLVLFGPTDPERWRPLGRTRVVRRDPLSELTVAEAAAVMIEIIDAKVLE